MKLRLEISGSIAADMRAELIAGEKAISDAVRGAALSLKTDWRGQITGAGLGARLARSIRSEDYPKGRPSLNAAALIWSNAPVIVGAHEEGPLIRSQSGLWLAIPTAAAGKSTRGGRITPAEWEHRRGVPLRFIYRARGPSLLVAEGRLNSRGLGVASRAKSGRGLASVPIFLLVRQVKLTKRLDLAKAAQAAVGRIPSAIVANWVSGKLGS